MYTPARYLYRDIAWRSLAVKRLPQPRIAQESVEGPADSGPRCAGSLQVKRILRLVARRGSATRNPQTEVLPLEDQQRPPELLWSPRLGRQPYRWPGVSLRARFALSRGFVLGSPRQKIFAGGYLFVPREPFLRSETIPNFERREGNSVVRCELRCGSSRLNPQDRIEQLDRDYARLGCDAYACPWSLSERQNPKSTNKESGYRVQYSKMDWGERPP